MNYNVITEALLFTSVWILILMLIDIVEFHFKNNLNKLKGISYKFAMMLLFIWFFGLSHNVTNDPLTNTISQYIMLLHLNFAGYIAGVTKYLTF